MLLLLLLLHTVVGLTGFVHTVVGLTGFVMQAGAAACASLGPVCILDPSVEPDFMSLLPEKRKWSESDQEAADREWRELMDKVSVASSPVASGGVSDVLVSFRGRVAARREMGKSLCFLSIHSLHRGDLAVREEKNWQVQKKGETLEVLVDLSRWKGQSDFYVEAGLLRLEAEVMLEGFCGKSYKHGDPLVYCRWARMTRAKPHPVYIATLLRHLIDRRLPALRVAEGLEMEVTAVEALVKLEVRPLRQQAARISRVMMGNNAHICRIRPPKLTTSQQRELDESHALRAAFPITMLGRPQELESHGQSPEELLQVQTSIPDKAKLEDSVQQRREKYSHGKKEPQVRWYVHRLRALMGFYRESADTGPSAWPFGDASAPDAGTEAAERRPEEAPESAEMGEGWVVVDIGGGRGDLAINVARLLPAVKVHVLEINTPSLVDAEKAANRLGASVSSRCFFREEDVTKLFTSPSILAAPTSDTPGIPGDALKVVLVGLHACGGLTDAILALARRHHVAFLCCPCCFMKHPHLRCLAHESDGDTSAPPTATCSDGVEGFSAVAATDASGSMSDTTTASWKAHTWEAKEWEARWERLARVGELSPYDGDAFADTAAAHRHAMHAMGAARLSRFDPEHWKVGVLSFSDRYSGRNLVLAGIPIGPRGAHTSHTPATQC